MKKYHTIIFLVLTAAACNNYDDHTGEIYHKNRNNVVNVENKIVDICIDSLEIFGRSRLYIVNDYLVIVDHQSQTHHKGIHLVNKNTFEYVTSIGDIGKGPGEITYYGHFGADEENNLFYGIDYGKLELFKFEMDSIFDISYKPKTVLKLSDEIFPASFNFLDDSTIIGNALDVIDPNTYKSTIVKMNIREGNIVKIGTPHADIDPINLTTFFALCRKNNVYVEGYSRHDLLTINSLNGSIKLNIYGPNWQKGQNKKNRHYSSIGIMHDKIIAAYRGEIEVTNSQSKRQASNFPTKFLIFDLDGNYCTTIDTGHGINNFCLDKENNRIIIYFETRDNPLAYINLKDILNV